MNNYRVVIDVGHGGDDIGCMLGNTPEKIVALELSKYMHQKFSYFNIPVTLVRSQDETLLPTERLKRIKEVYGDHKYVIVISNHVSMGEQYEIVYGLKQNGTLARRIASNLILNHESVVCHSKRLGMCANKDYYLVHREIANMQVLRITYPFLLKRGDLDKGVEQIVNAIYAYIGGKEESNLYEVVKGDTMWNVAKKFHLSVDELKSLNGFSDNLLRTGDCIRVVSHEQNFPYIVSKGENLYQICKKFQVSIEDVMRHNHKKSNFIRIGELLYIPRKEIRHIVQEGENLYQIASQYQISIEDIMKKNQLVDSQVFVGDPLIIEKTS